MINHKHLLQRTLKVCFKGTTENHRKIYRYFYKNEPMQSAEGLLHKMEQVSDDSSLKDMLPIIFPSLPVVEMFESQYSKVTQCLKDSFLLLNTKIDVDTSKYMMEEDVQAHLEQSWLNNNEFDYCISSFQRYHSPSPAALFPNKEGMYMFTGKPDFTSAVAPLWLELKLSEVKVFYNSSECLSANPARSKLDTLKKKFSGNVLSSCDYEVIHQGLERVLTTARLNDLLKVIVAISTAGYVTYCHVITKQFDLENKIVESLYIFPISNEEIVALWRLINEIALKYPNTIFRYNESVMICRTLNQLFPNSVVDPMFCRIKLISNPRSSSLYHVIFYDFTNEDYCVNVKEQKRSIVIKLPTSNRFHRNAQEIQILKALKDITASDYVIGIQEFELAKEFSIPVGNTHCITCFDDALFLIS
jgi:hypothetical protein